MSATEIRHEIQRMKKRLERNETKIENLEDYIVNLKASYERFLESVSNRLKEVQP